MLHLDFIPRKKLLEPTFVERLFDIESRHTKEQMDKIADNHHQKMSAISHRCKDGNGCIRRVKDFIKGLKRLGFFHHFAEYLLYSHASNCFRTDNCFCTDNFGYSMFEHDDPEPRIGKAQIDALIEQLRRTKLFKDTKIVIDVDHNFEDATTYFWVYVDHF